MSSTELLDRAERLLEAYRDSLSGCVEMRWAAEERDAIDAWKRDKAEMEKPEDREDREDREWHFHRLNQYGQRMAEGARVHAATEQEAREKAKKLFSEPGDDQQWTFLLLPEER
jgi:hypothetical protein